MTEQFQSEPVPPAVSRLGRLARRVQALLRGGSRIDGGPTDVLQTAWLPHGRLDAVRLPPRRNLPSISVVVPLYNSASFVTRRLASILHQRWPIAELVLLDDASSDETLEAVARFASLHGLALDVVSNGTNSGSPWAQWRRSMPLISGDLVWIAEADDLAHPDFLCALVPRFRSPGLAIAFANSCSIDEHDRVREPDTRRWITGDRRLLDRDFQMSGGEFLARCLCIQNVLINVSGVLIRRRVLAAVLDRLEERLAALRTTGDWLVYCECLKCGDIAFTPRVLNACRRHSASLSYRADPRQHFQEVVSVQAQAIRCAGSGEAAVARATEHASLLARHLALDPDFAASAMRSAYATALDHAAPGG
ncbi:MAG: glycosyltransferase family 2 protein [Azospirillaceae bacterium]